MNIKFNIWNKETNTLFDYDADNYLTNSFEVNRTTKIIRQKNKIIENLYAFSNDEGYVSDIEYHKKEDYYVIKPDMNIMYYPWIIIKYSFSEQGYKLRIGDYIKLGKICFLVKDLFRANSKNINFRLAKETKKSNKKSSDSSNINKNSIKASINNNKSSKYNNNNNNNNNLNANMTINTNLPENFNNNYNTNRQNIEIQSNNNNNNNIYNSNLNNQNQNQNNFQQYNINSEQEDEESIINYNKKAKNSKRKRIPTCKICFCEDNNDENPLLNPCNCIGSVGLTHLECLRTWLHSKMTKRSAGFLTLIAFKKLTCEICKATFPEKLKFKNKIYSLIQPNNSEKSYIMLEAISTKESVSETRYIYIIQLMEGESLSMGRNNEADIKLNDISVSRIHAYVCFNNNDFYLKDKNSKFGTLVKLQKPIVVIPGLSLFLQYGKFYLSFSAHVGCWSCGLCKKKHKYSNVDYNDFLSRENNNEELVELEYSFKSSYNETEVSGRMRNEFGVKSEEKKDAEEKIINNNDNMNVVNEGLYNTNNIGNSINSYNNVFFNNNLYQNDDVNNNVNNTANNNAVNNGNRNINLSHSVINDMTENNLLNNSNRNNNIGLSSNRECLIQEHNNKNHYNSVNTQPFNINNPNKVVIRSTIRSMIPATNSDANNNSNSNNLNKRSIFDISSKLKLNKIINDEDIISDSQPQYKDSFKSLNNNNLNHNTMTNNINLNSNNINIEFKNLSPINRKNTHKIEFSYNKKNEFDNNDEKRVNHSFLEQSVSNSIEIINNQLNMRANTVNRVNYNNISNSKFDNSNELNLNRNRSKNTRVSKHTKKSYITYAKMRRLRNPRSLSNNNINNSDDMNNESLSLSSNAKNVNFSRKENNSKNERNSHINHQNSNNNEVKKADKSLITTNSKQSNSISSNNKHLQVVSISVEINSNNINENNSNSNSNNKISKSSSNKLSGNSLKITDVNQENKVNDTTNNNNKNTSNKMSMSIADSHYNEIKANKDLANLYKKNLDDSESIIMNDIIEDESMSNKASYISMGLNKIISNDNDKSEGEDSRKVSVSKFLDRIKPKILQNNNKEENSIYNNTDNNPAPTINLPTNKALKLKKKKNSQGENMNTSPLKPPLIPNQETICIQTRVNNLKRNSKEENKENKHTNSLNNFSVKSNDESNNLNYNTTAFNLKLINRKNSVSSNKESLYSSSFLSKLNINNINNVNNVNNNYINTDNIRKKKKKSKICSVKIKKGLNSSNSNINLKDKDKADSGSVFNLETNKQSIKSKKYLKDQNNNKSQSIKDNDLVNNKILNEAHLDKLLTDLK